MLWGIFNPVDFEKRIYLFVHPEGEEVVWGGLPNLLVISSQQVGMARKKLKKDEVIAITKTIKITKDKYFGDEVDVYKYDVYAGVEIYVSKDKKKELRIESNIIKLIVYLTGDSGLE